MHVRRLLTTAATVAAVVAVPVTAMAGSSADRATGGGQILIGKSAGDTITFTRPDGDQILHATNGMATGLKYLATKKDCLTVKPGEGYCRD